MVRSSAVQRGRVTGPKSTSEPARKTHVLLFQQEFLNAVKGGELGRVKELLAMDPDLIFASDASGVSVLLIAAYKRNQRVAAHLLSLRDELNIWEAAALGHRDHLAALLDADSSQVNAPAVDGYIPLGLASFFGHLDCAGLLLEYGADVNAVSRNAMRLRPLHSAVTHDDPARAMPVTQLLLSAGANVNAAQERGYTALHRAADRGSLELVQLLMRHGADAGICAENGLTAAEMAIAKCYHEIAAATGYRAAEARF